MEASKIKSDFEREFKPSKIPFGDIVDSNADFKHELFLQFCDADIKPCFDLYLADFYSPEEISNGFEDAINQISISTSKAIVPARFIYNTPFEARVRKLFSDFGMKITKNELPSKYYCNDIKKTTIAETLNAIDGQLNILKKSALDEKTDKYKEAEISAQTVIQLALKLGKFSSIILEFVKQDNDNIFLDIRRFKLANYGSEIDGKPENADISVFESWEAIKRNFNILISKPLSLQSEDETPEKSNEYNFNASEWATIFYYADTVKEISGDTVSKKIENFREKHGVTLSLNSLNNHYYTIKKSININNDYPIEKLEIILPFIQTKYPDAVDRIQGDKDFLKNELTERQ